MRTNALKNPRSAFLFSKACIRSDSMGFVSRVSCKGGCQNCHLPERLSERFSNKPHKKTTFELEGVGAQADARTANELSDISVGVASTHILTAPINVALVLCEANAAVRCLRKM